MDGIAMPIIDYTGSSECPTVKNNIENDDNNIDSDARRHSHHVSRS
jgi:hypothetical protein